VHCWCTEGFALWLGHTLQQVTQQYRCLVAASLSMTAVNRSLLAEDMHIQK
jgi:hypothetical protein